EELDEGAADREPEAHALGGGAGTALGLDEGLEHALERVGRDPGAGVLDREGGAAVAPVDAHGDAAGAGELHGVAAQVAEDLAQLALVAAYERRQPGRHLEGEAEPAPLGARAEEVLHAVEELARREVDEVRGGLARLDLRDRQDVVDEPEEMLAGPR